MSYTLLATITVCLVQTKSFFIFVINIEFKTKKFRLSLCFSNILNLSFSSLNFPFMRVMKRVFVGTNHTVTLAKKVYDIYSSEYFYSLRDLSCSYPLILCLMYPTSMVNI